MPIPELTKCSYFGPAYDSKADPGLLPADYATKPFKYLPPRITLSKAELELARRYENGDLSGGYISSQIAFFRRGPSAAEHQRRRDRFRQLKAEVDQLGLILPEAYVQLMESDDYVSRLRHNTIKIQLPDELVSLPSNPECWLFLIFGEGQGCGFWHLLLAPGGEQVVSFAEDPIGLRGMYAPGRQPALASLQLFQCAGSFCEWIVKYFEESIQEDRRYEDILDKYPGE
jgi:hypothetical protein